MIKKGLRYCVVLYFIALIVSIIKSVTFDINIVQSSSMYPTLHDGEFILIKKYSYNIKTPEYLPLTNIKIPILSFNGLEKVQKGDIAVFKFPSFINGQKDTSNLLIVKRITGLPCDTIETSCRYFGLDIPSASNSNNIFNKSYLRIPHKGDSIIFKNNNHKYFRDIILGEGHTFEKISDSTILIDGKPSLFYVVEKDYYYMRGDNEKYSYDSRQWGFLPKDKLIAKVLF